MLSDAVIDFVAASGGDEAQWARRASDICPLQGDAGKGMLGIGKECTPRAVGRHVATVVGRHERHSVVPGRPTPHSDDNALHLPVVSDTAVACVRASSSSLVKIPFPAARPAGLCKAK